MPIVHLRAPEAPVTHESAPGSAASSRALPLPASATLSEIFAGSGRDVGAVGFALTQAGGSKPLLWVQDRMSILETGRPYPPGLDADFIHVEARDAKAALWAMEEGLRCSGLRAVIGEIWGNPRALDFTATRRLAVAAERSGVAAILLLFGAVPSLSGARMRWHASSRPSLSHPHDAQAPGAPAWSLDLFKARGVDPGCFEVVHDDRQQAEPSDRFRLLPRLGDGEPDLALRRAG